MVPMQGDNREGAGDADARQRSRESAAAMNKACRRRLGTRSACQARRRRAGCDDTGIGVDTIRRGWRWQ